VQLPVVPVHSFEDVTLDMEALQGSGIFWGSGAPTFIPAAKAVSFYFRKDTPTVANQRIYIYTGSAWTGIV
jgi:hypothetical protein